MPTMLYEACPACQGTGIIETEKSSRVCRNCDLRCVIASGVTREQVAKLAKRHEEFMGFEVMKVEGLPEGVAFLVKPGGEEAFLAAARVMFQAEEVGE